MIPSHNISGVWSSKSTLNAVLKPLSLATSLVVVCASLAVATDQSVRQSRPIQRGVSGSNIESKCYSATAGSLAKKGEKRFALSDNHALAREDNGEKGELNIQPGSLGTCLHPVDLLLAGSDTSTVANSIKTVYEELNVKPIGCKETTAQCAPEGDGVQDNRVIAKAMQIKERHEEQLLNLPGVVGVGIGLEDGEVVIKVFLEEMTPGLERVLPNTLEGFTVVPEVTGKFIAH